MCVDIANAFADLHEAGVLHGDVHPRNVLVEGRGTVRLIDFGLAQPIEKTSGSGIRGGVAFYFDPEFAEAQRTHKEAILGAAGEQYSVASLLYQLWTGAYYIDWSLEREALLRQIVEVDPAPFEARNVPAWPALEAVLLRALQKRQTGGSRVCEHSPRHSPGYCRRQTREIETRLCIARSERGKRTCWIKLCNVTR